MKTVDLRFRGIELFRQILPAAASSLRMPSELERLYDAHAQALFSFVLNVTHSEADTRDALQEVFVKLATRPHMLADIRDERGFLLRIAHNIAIDAMRRRTTRERGHERLIAEQESIFAPTDSPDDRGFREAVAGAMAELPLDQRAVLHLKLWEGFTFDTIADALGISPNTAASRYRYALDKLRIRLRPLYDELK